MQAVLDVLIPAIAFGVGVVGTLLFGSLRSARAAQLETGNSAAPAGSAGRVLPSAEGATLPESVPGPDDAPTVVLREPPTQVILTSGRGVLSAADAGELAGELLAVAAQLDSAEQRRTLITAAGRLGEVIAPAERTPFDPEQHSAGRPIRTVDPVRAGTIAHLLSPGVRSRDGVVVRRAEVRCHVYDEL